VTARAAARKFLERYATLAIVGLSRDPGKEAHAVPAELQAAGFRVIPVNPFAGSILGEPAYPTLLDVPGPVEAVVVFRPAEDAPAVARDAVRAGAQALWLQLGIVSPEARRIAAEAGLLYVEDRCTAVDRARYGITKHL
jgi:predicted CoA-binding protein